MELLQHHMLYVIVSILNNSCGWLLISFNFVILYHFKFLYCVNSKTYATATGKILAKQFIGMFYGLIYNIEVMLIHLNKF
jgi:hypothetical protein